MADEQLINEIVRRVLEQLGGAPSQASASASVAAEPLPLAPAANEASPLPAPAPHPNPIAAQPSPARKTFITADELVRRAGKSKSVVLAPAEVLTPNAQDYVDLHGVSVTRQTSAAPQPAKPLPMGSATILPSSQPIGLVVDRGDAKVASALTALGRQGLCMPRFDATDCWMRNSSSMLKAVIAGQLSGGVILAPSGIEPTVYANKYRGVRAVLGLSADVVAQAVQAVDANVLVVDHSRCSFFEIRTLIQTFADQRSRPRPACSILEVFARLEGRA